MPLLADGEEATAPTPPVLKVVQVEAAAKGALTHAAHMAHVVVNEHRAADSHDGVLLELGGVLVEERVRLGTIGTTETSGFDGLHDLLGRGLVVEGDVLVDDVRRSRAGVGEVLVDLGVAVAVVAVALGVDGLPPRVVVVHLVGVELQRDAVEQHLHVTIRDPSVSDLTPVLCMLSCCGLSHDTLLITNKHSIAASVFEAVTNNRFTHQQCLATPQSQTPVLGNAPSVLYRLIIRSPEERSVFLAQGCE